MAASILLFSVQDALMKWLSADYGFWQIIFFARLLAPPLAVVMAWRSGGLAQLATRRPLAQLMRAGLTVADMLMFTVAISLIPLADAIAIGFAAPLFMTALSVPLLRERVGPRRWSAVIAGFVGVLVVLQPAGAGFGPASMLALGSAVAFALIIIMTRTLTLTESVPCLMFWNSGVVAIVTGLAMLTEWKTPTGLAVGLFALSAVIGAAAQALITEAFRLGEVSLLAPIQYTTLLWASLLGLAVFGDRPTPTLLAGAAIIIASALYIVRREAQLARRLRPGTAPPQVLGAPETEAVVVQVAVDLRDRPPT